MHYFVQQKQKLQIFWRGRISSMPVDHQSYVADVDFSPLFYFRQVEATLTRNAGDLSKIIEDLSQKTKRKGRPKLTSSNESVLRNTLDCQLDLSVLLKSCHVILSELSRVKASFDANKKTKSAARQASGGSRLGEKQRFHFSDAFCLIPLTPVVDLKVGCKLAETSLLEEDCKESSCISNDLSSLQRTSFTDSEKLSRDHLSFDLSVDNSRPSDMWECAICTSLNSLRLRKCDVCYSRKPQSIKKSLTVVRNAVVAILDTPDEKETALLKIKEERSTTCELVKEKPSDPKTNVRELDRLSVWASSSNGESNHNDRSSRRRGQIVRYYEDEVSPDIDEGGGNYFNPADEYEIGKKRKIQTKKKNTDVIDMTSTTAPNPQGKWICAACTMENLKRCKLCDMCGNPRVKKILKVLDDLPSPGRKLPRIGAQYQVEVPSNITCSFDGAVKDENNKTFEEKNQKYHHSNTKKYDVDNEHWEVLWLSNSGDETHIDIEGPWTEDSRHDIYNSEDLFDEEISAFVHTHTHTDPGEVIDGVSDNNDNSLVPTSEDESDDECTILPYILTNIPVHSPSNEDEDENEDDNEDEDEDGNEDKDEDQSNNGNGKEDDNESVISCCCFWKEIVNETLTGDDITFKKTLGGNDALILSSSKHSKGEELELKIPKRSKWKTEVKDKQLDAISVLNTSELSQQIDKKHRHNKNRNQANQNTSKININNHENKIECLQHDKLEKEINSYLLNFPKHQVEALHTLLVNGKNVYKAYSAMTTLKNENKLVIKEVCIVLKKGKRRKFGESILLHGKNWLAVQVQHACMISFFYTIIFCHNNFTCFYLLDLSLLYC